jgi:hypothetical protein
MPLRLSRRLVLLGLTLSAAAVLIVVVLVVLLGRGTPELKFRPGDRTVPPGEVTEWSFDADPVGGLPPGVEVYDGSWAVQEEDDAPSPPHVLRQTGTATFPVLCLADKVYADLDMTVRFKAVSGKKDQAAGILFHVQDRHNYYILRANALEDNVNLYVFAGGKRSQIKGASVKVAAGQWHELRVEAVGDRLKGYLDGRLLIEATDSTFAAGKVGLWTKADSVTCFDNVRVTAR